jgi:transposase
MTCLENNIKCHFRKYVDQFVRVSLEASIIEDNPELSEKELRHEINSTCSKKTTELLNLDIFEDSWIQEIRNFVLPHKTFKKNSVYYDIQCSPMDYLESMIRMMDFVERNSGKLLSAVPLRTSMIPKHVLIDSTTLIQIFSDHEAMKVIRKIKATKGLTITRDHLHGLWNIFFKIDKKPFKAKRKFFQYMIRTDGVSCSVHLGNEPKKEGKGHGKKSKSIDFEEKYIDEIEWDSSKIIVGIDPNMGDLLYCSTEDGTETYRYTQNERRHDLDTKRYGFIRWKEKTTTIIDGRNVEEWESTLSEFNHKTASETRFRDYIKQKLFVNEKLRPFYERRIFRKLRLSTFYNTRKSEQKLIKKFEATFGGPEDVVIGMGDWCEKEHRSHHEPVKGKGFRDLFRRAGYKLGLVNEFRTSSRCSKCKGPCLKFQEGTKKTEQRVRLIHGLLLCQQCGRIWNRDANSAINIAKITRCCIEKTGRPEYLSRQQNFSGGKRNASSNRRHIDGSWFTCSVT